MAAPSPRPALRFSPPPEPASSSGLRLKDLTPRTAGHYLLLDEIGSGGMATVHLARVDGPGGFQRWFALKRIHPDLARDDQLVDMFLDEARTAARINHANVVQVFEVGKDDDTYWLAMEYLHGEPLRELMRRAAHLGLRIPAAIAARICADAAAGLHAAHELRTPEGAPLGLVHRDVSPHNLFVTDEGHTKIVDFGIAKTAERLAQATGIGVLKGKLAYMSPEQVTGAPVDRTTDVFALGIVLWELTTGARLFRAETDFETLTKLLDGVVPRPSSLVPGYPPDLEACVLRALARRKEDRYPTAREFSRALERWMMTSAAFAGEEEVASLVRRLCADRIAARDARLRAAAGEERHARSANIDRAIIDEDDEALTVILRAPEEPGESSAIDLGNTLALPVTFAAPSPAYAPKAAPPAPTTQPAPLAPASPYRLAPAVNMPVPLAPPRRGRPILLAAIAALSVAFALALALLALAR